jgi:hypothetical protein
MVHTSTVRLIGLASLLGLACSNEDTGQTATLSDSATETFTVTNASSNPSNDDDDGTDAASASEPTGGGEAEAGQTDTGETTNVATSTSPGTTDDPETTGPNTSDAESSTSGPPPDTTTGETTADPDTTDGETSNTTDEDTTDTGVDPDCQAPGTQPPCDQGTSDIFKAIGLNCSADKSMAIPISNPVISSPAANAYRVATHYGSAKDPGDPNLWAWGPKEGERLLVIGTGTFPALQPDGGLTEPDSLFGENVDTANGNPDNQNDLPGVMTWAKGSNNGNGGTPFMNCDGAKDCSDTLDPQWNIAQDNTANDIFYMSFDLEVPLGTHGYLFDFAYFSQEWPTYVDTDFNDMFVVWSTSESFTGNVTFINDQPLTVTALDPFMAIQPGDPLLAGTGFPDTFIDTDGAGTGWFTAKGSATPGETFTVAIAIFDMGDDILDTIGLIDKFRWDCEGCIPSEVDSCGIEPQ